MSKTKVFDVLIVYTESLAVSASNTSSDNNTPFKLGSNSESYNTVYGYFLEVCRRNGISVGFTTSKDIVGPGTCRSFWSYKNHIWLKNNNECYSNLIFDKFSPTNKRIRNSRKLLFSSQQIKAFNDPKLFKLFFDKQMTYDLLFKYSIPTVSIVGKNIHSINTACKKLRDLMKLYPGLKDFSRDVIMKDRFGAGGNRIYKFELGKGKNMLAIVNKYPRVSFILQPFAIFDKGFTYKDIPASTDIRLIYLDGKIVQSYIRSAKQGDFRCNEHQGGTLTYTLLKDIPKMLISKSNIISKLLKSKKSLFALDYIISNNGNAYLLEGNTGPGLDWNLSLKRNEHEAKKLIRMVVKALFVRIQNKIALKPRVVVKQPFSTLPAFLSGKLSVFPITQFSHNS
jgi:glutathione synthase/RimK-type ligase-like ATP-grasp enzyme